jgi:hypothetical protein
VDFIDSGVMIILGDLVKAKMTQNLTLFIFMDIRILLLQGIFPEKK